MNNRFIEEIEVFERMRKIATKLDDQWMLAFCFFGLGMGALVRGDFPAARQYAEQEFDLCDKNGDMIGSTMPYIILGHTALASGEPQQARDYYQRSMAIGEQVGFHYATQTATKYLGKVAVSLGDIEASEEYLHRSLTISKEIGFLRDITRLLYEYARLRRMQGRQEESVELLSLIIGHPASEQFRWLEGYLRQNIKDLLEELEKELPGEIFTGAIERGKCQELEKVVERILAAYPNS
jgi:tetratricopeptide (TPR) repeat protein